MSVCNGAKIDAPKRHIGKKVFVFVLKDWSFAGPKVSSIFVPQPSVGEILSGYCEDVFVHSSKISSIKRKAST